MLQANGLELLFCKIIIITPTLPLPLTPTLPLTLTPTLTLTLTLTL